MKLVGKLRFWLAFLMSRCSVLQQVQRRLTLLLLEMYVDLGAEKIIAAERNGQKIAVEIKSFVGPSNISEFHTAMGQFINYRVALEEQYPDRTLYLAVPLGTYQAFFSLQFIQTVIRRFEVKVIVYDPANEVIWQVIWQWQPN